MAAYYRVRGLDVTAEEVLITSGSQQALDLLGRVFLNPGDVLINEQPGYQGALLAFALSQPRFVGVPMDAEGMAPEALDAALVFDHQQFEGPVIPGQGPGDQQAPIPPAPPRRLVPAKPSPEIADKTSLLDLNDRICRWPMGHPGEPDFHFCGEKVNPGFPYCVEHCGRAYQAQLPRGHRRPPPPLPFGGPRVR